MKKKDFNGYLEEIVSLDSTSCATIDVENDDRIEGKGFLYDLALYFALRCTINNPKYINEKKVIEELGWNNIIDFLSTMSKYHSGDKAGEIVTIHTVINKPLLFHEIDELHKTFIKAFPIHYTKAMVEFPFVHNIVNGSYYFVDALDEIEKLTLFNCMIRRWSKRECIDSLYLVPTMTPLVLDEIVHLSKEYAEKGLPDGIESFIDYFAQSGVTLDLVKHFNEYCKAVPDDDSHIRVQTIKDKCKEIIKDNEIEPEYIQDEGSKHK